MMRVILRPAAKGPRFTLPKKKKLKRVQNQMLLFGFICVVWELYSQSVLFYQHVSTESFPSHMA